MKGDFILLITLMMCASLVFAQAEKDEVFHELEIGYTYINNEKWRGGVAANWKHIYDDLGWRRWGGDAYISRKVKYVSFEAGLTANYTFDKEIVNYFEIRPWIGLRSDLELTKRLSLMQKLKVESRHFLYGVKYLNEQRTRSRFLMSLKYDVLKGREDWKVNPTCELYFVGKAADAERFSNSIEFGLRIIKVFRHERELAIGYKRESYKSDFISDHKHGHILVLEYAF